MTADVISNVMLIPAPMASRDQKGHIVPHFDCLDQGYVMVPLMMPSALCDADLVSMTSHDQEHHVAPHFNGLDLRNAIMSLMILLTF